MSSQRSPFKALGEEVRKMSYFHSLSGKKVTFDLTQAPEPKRDEDNDTETDTGGTVATS